AHYEITGKLGEGAMGEVYRATDSRLKRDVAIKLLSSRLAADPELVARLRREAEVLASLNHTHIGQIYGLEPAGDSIALVLELVEGETLADRLKKGALPPDRALRVAHQIAAALETAHESGIIHRDLKPANVKRTPEGDVKVLDFGLAKGIRLHDDATALTADGQVIGPPAYMSPEQVAGKPLDRRTDIWSFGCVIFEMLTGSKAFAGDSVGSLFAAIATENPQLDLVADAPPPVRQLIERCLRKDPRTRLRDIGDARIELEEIIAGRAETEPEGEPARRRPVLTGLALLVGGLVGALAMSQPTAKSEPTPEPIAQYSIPLFPPPSTLHLDGPTGAASPLAISRDGRQVVFSAIDASGERLLYLRRAGDARPTKIQNTAGAEAPFFSFDGSQVGFYVSGGAKLRCVTLADSSVKDLFESIVIRGSSWAADGSIVFADTDLGIRRLTMVDGKPHVEEITTVSAEEHHHRWPQILPDGEHVLFSVLLRNRSVEPRIVSLRTKKVVRIDLQGSLVRYLDGGYLVYTKADHIWAVRFDLAAQEKVGDPVRILSGIYVPQLGNPHVALNADGVLVYEPFRPPSPGRTLVWVERDGSKQVIASDRNYEFPRLSPDESQLVFADHGKTNSHSICRINLLRKPYKSQQITTDGNYIEPTWSPKGDAIIFSEFRELNLWIMNLGGV
ncbi:MAG: protein kinase domain-containing protein, partial [Planctomycetota bacterium]